MTKLSPKRLVTFLFIITIVLTLLAVFQSSLKEQPQAAQTPTPKYIFVFLADGAGITHLELARTYSKELLHEGLTISEKIMKEGFVGFLTTHSADSLVTDSAAAATALAGGCKTKNWTVGICADGRIPKTVMELARQKGMRIGLVTNAAIYDASPAAFVSHVSNRKQYRSIVEQYLEFGPDLMLGGGHDQFLLPGPKGSSTKEHRNFISLFKEKGYAYVSTKRELADVKNPKVLGLFSLKEMSFEIRRDIISEPSLYDMTEAAIRILQRRNTTGFVVLIENENIDTAAHQNDALSVVYDFLEFDRAVGLAYDFYKDHPTETLLLITSDHETGGLAINWKKKEPNITASDDTLSKLVGRDRAQGVEISWSTTGHTHQPVPVSALGVGAERFRGYQDNTDFAKHLFALLEENKLP